MPYTLAPRTDFEALPTAEYVLTLKAWKEVIEQADTQFSKKGDVRIEWNWIVTVPNADSQERRDWTNIPTTFAAKSTFVHIAIALGIVDSAKAIEDGATIDPDAGVGKSCLGTIVKSLKADNKTWGDKITQYAPLILSTAPVVAPKQDMASKLRERLATLMTFAGDKGEPPARLPVAELKAALNLIGARPTTDAARQVLKEYTEAANMLGINDFDDTAAPATLKDAFLLFERITAKMDA